MVMQLEQDRVNSEELKKQKSSMMKDLICFTQCREANTCSCGHGNVQKELKFQWPEAVIWPNSEQFIPHLPVIAPCKDFLWCMREGGNIPV